MKNAACNIGPENQKRRRWIGYVSLVIAGLLSGYFIAAQTPALYRMIVFPFFLVGFLGLLQAETKVCVTNAFQKKVGME